MIKTMDAAMDAWRAAMFFATVAVIASLEVCRAALDEVTPNAEKGGDLIS